MEGSTRKLSDVPWKELRLGDKVRSAKGTSGSITTLVSEDDYSIWIEWENDEISAVYHHQAQAVIYLE